MIRNNNGVHRGHVLVGHFLTRRQVARRVAIDSGEVLQRPDLLRIGGTWLEEVYFAFQFDSGGVIQTLGSAVAHLRRAYDDESIADWLGRPHTALSSTTPLAWLAAGGSGDQFEFASEVAGPDQPL